MTYYTNSKEGFNIFLDKISCYSFHTYICDIRKFKEDFKEYIINCAEYEDSYVFTFESDYWFDTLTARKENIFEIRNKHILIYL